MNSLTYLALIRSIKHWDRMSRGQQGPTEVPDEVNCALCQRFTLSECYSVDDEEEQCPVYRHTKDFCNNTPYTRASYIYNTQGMNNKAFRSAARMEHFFLRSLLFKD